jgi:hypothetical protein
LRDDLLLKKLRLARELRLGEVELGIGLFDRALA